MKMAIATVASILVVMLALPTVFGTDHTVGGSSGWNLGVDYTTWASGETFTVGDNLVFSYDSNHALDEVDKSGYDSCSSSNAIKSYSDGNTKIALTSTGTRYFLCPKPGHCAGGMKLAVNVVAASGGSPPSSGTPPTTPSSGGSPPSTTPSTTPSTPSSTPSSPSPKPNAATGLSSGISLLMGSFFVVLGLMA